MATLNEVNKIFDKYFIESLIYRFLNMIRFDLARGYAQYGSISYCQFIKVAQSEEKEDGGLVNDYNYYFSVKGFFGDKNIKLCHIKNSEPQFKNLLDVLLPDPQKNISINYSLKINEKIVCDFTRFNSRLIINSFHFEDWIDFLNNEINIREKEIFDESRNDYDHKYNSNLDQKLFTINKNKKNCGPQEKIKNHLIQDIKIKRKINIKKRVIKKDSDLIKEFKRGNRSKNLIISLMGVLTKKNIEVKGEGVKYTVSWNHGKIKKYFNKSEAISYIEKKMLKL
jgi:hypothetical protein